MKNADVLIQAGHEGRRTGATGGESKWGREIDWTPTVANIATAILSKNGISVIREDASLYDTYHVNLALFLHFDASVKPCNVGASIGYDDESDKPAADAWKTLYSKYWPFKWMTDNYIKNLRNYYGLKFTYTTDAELVLELGEITCKYQAEWLKPRLIWLGELIAHFISQRLNKGNIQDPGEYKCEPIIT